MKRNSAGAEGDSSPSGRDRERPSWFSRHAFLMDCVLAACMWLTLVAPFIPEFLADDPVPGVPGFLLYSTLVIPLAWRRRAPLTSAGIITAAYALQLALSWPILAGNVSVFWVVYALAAFGPRWSGKLAFAVALAGDAAAIVVYSFLTLDVGQRANSAVDFAIEWSVTAAFLGISWLLGNQTRSRKRILAELRERARRLEVEQQKERELSAADERARIAREMHDIVAHSLSVIVTQADGGRYAARADPGLATKTLETIAQTARESLTEMRRLLGVLRSDDGVDTRPVPSLAEVDTLVEQLRDAGVPVEAARVGEQRAELPAGAELVAYRVIQEAFTNVLKHAGPGVSVRLLRSWNSQGLAIEVDDNGRGAAADDTGALGGHGIQGMAERVALYGGTLETGPRRGGGFRVSALIPYEEER